ncbi:MAG: response regulator transcription factor, partial [Deltaproteobacteria bacterium]|nr:response regulator transcription factor [Deltaproteobacteria bacterium]
MGIRILLAESHRILRETLRISFEKRNDDMEIIAEAEDGSTAVKLVEELKPDVVIMGLALPELNSIEVTRRIISKFPDIKVVALSMHSDRRSVSGMLKAGASGFLIRNCSFEELCQAIRTVFAHQIYLSPEIMIIV